MILPPLGLQIRTEVNGDGYLVLKELAQLFQPYLLKNPTSIIPSHLNQRGSYSTYHAEAMFFYELQGWIFNNVYNFGDKNYQNYLLLIYNTGMRFWKLQIRSVNCLMQLIVINTRLVVSFPLSELLLQILNVIVVD